MGYQSIDEMSQGARIIWALIAISVGLLAILLANPSSEQQQFAIALAGGAFVFAGLSIATYSKSDPRIYHWVVTLMLGCMLGILLWLAFGAGERSCGFPLPFWGQDTSCRVIAGISAVILGLILSMAMRQALKARRAAV